VTSGNAGPGHFSFHIVTSVFPLSGMWCSGGARLFRNGPCRGLHARGGQCRPVRILV
jgi:hypothetical protein